MGEYRCEGMHRGNDTVDNGEIMFRWVVYDIGLRWVSGGCNHGFRPTLRR